MIECILSIVLILYGLNSGNTECFIAAGLFAIACNLQKATRKEDD